MRTDGGVAAAVTAFGRFSRDGDWRSWARLFTSDALYEDHCLGTHRGRGAIEEWITGLRGADRTTVWIEWSMTDGDLACLYAWYNLPDPTAGRMRSAHPGTVLLRYAGGGLFDRAAGFRNGDAADSMAERWRTAGGGDHQERDHSLRGIVGYAPEPPRAATGRDEVARAFAGLAGLLGPAAGDGRWAPVVESFTEDMRLRDHARGFLVGRPALRAWVLDGVRRAPFTGYEVRARLIDGNRVSALLRGRADTGHVDLNVLLHYAGQGRWSYLEVVYNPQEIRALRT